MPKIDNLPPEIILEIISFSLAAHNRCPSSLHPLNAIATTNKYLNAIVEEYTRGLLKQQLNFTPPKSSKTFSCRRKWLAETCQFCKRKSQRRSIMYADVTCCRLCDKQYFPKITMTQATKEYDLSKLDLFTPNELHPTLPPLTSGLYTVMGSAATMILQRDVVARKAYIQRSLGAKGADTVYMHRRPAAHDRIIAHMGLYFSCGNGSRGSGWRKAPVLSEAAMEKVAKSMRTEEGRREYVRKGLEREWEAMGMMSGGREAMEGGAVGEGVGEDVKIQEERKDHAKKGSKWEEDVREVEMGSEGSVEDSIDLDCY
ncbi:hypothetical protein GQ44DRAFT_748327 [Phaeosphaeriaceae sp. PMI808]|nr:hypothetical protein GQ44DRAFT_748327 [Phaeosphaeriaceae sp. PMI808]